MLAFGPGGLSRELGSCDGEQPFTAEAMRTFGWKFGLKRRHFSVMETAL
jgi:hypothetical protein